MPYFKYGDLVETMDGRYEGVICPNPDGSDDLEKSIYVAWKASPTRTGSATFHPRYLQLSDSMEVAARTYETEAPNHWKKTRTRLAEFGEILEGQGFHRSQILAAVADGEISSLLLGRWYLERLVRIKLADLSDTDDNGDRATSKRRDA